MAATIFSSSPSKVTTPKVSFYLLPLLPPAPFFLCRRRRRQIFLALHAAHLLLEASLPEGGNDSGSLPQASARAVAVLAGEMQACRNEPPKLAPLTARERLRAARVLGKYAEPGGGSSQKGKAAAAAGKPEFGRRVLDALRETDGEKKRRSRLPEAPSNMFDDSKRGLPKEGWTFEALPFGTDVLVIVASFTLITAVMFGTTYLVWKLGAIHFNELY
ncbi:hypothetical protein E2562_037443 [Oryza meyeriana var. granulata]|uniref:Uncharacterized protein n=1 Tax=Oryza meyeriana var. granulata TaxID=110450 RepID=A0A6G1FGK0_9ORYZ|nr:hypothetical protein E2562_037443 [Oryza meyeriana var. granulata]